jgi:beta-glucosidase/6-phospho-beta-glucosidase/beta-galactosidase
MLPANFSWCAGIEDTFILDRDPRTGRSLDEYELTGHYERWREDIDALASLGVDSIRWGLPWHLVAPEPGAWDWSWTDQVIERITCARGLELMADLVHYGTPRWMPEGFADPDYPRRVEEYAAAFAERYRGTVRWATPCNEPDTAAIWSGKRGEWPPHLKSEEGFLRVLVQATLGAAYSSAALASAGIKCAHIEVAGGVRLARGIDDPALAAEAELERGRQRLYWDLLFGLMNDSHPLRAYLEAHGIGEEAISRIAAVRAPVDFIGMNYYPQWSFLEYRRAEDGGIATRELSSGAAGLAELCRDFAVRYGKPLFITETSWRGSPEEKIAWMDESVTAVEALVDEGLPIIGYTWFPVLEMIDWSWRTGSSKTEDGRLNLGFWDLERRENSAAEAYRRLVGDSR